jgi:transcription-repair coupling factor (superfamily II helicase)
MVLHQSADLLFQSGIENVIKFINNKHVHNIKAVVLCIPKHVIRQKIRLLLKDSDVVAEDVDAFAKVQASKKHSVFLVPLDISHSFIWQNIAFIAQKKIIDSKMLVRISPKQQPLNKKLSLSSDIQAGDHIVHRMYGIGVFNGFEMITIGSIKHDCVSITYANNNKLFVPVEHLGQITPYRHNGDIAIELDHLGRKTWDRNKKIAQSKIQELAYKIIKLASERKKIPNKRYDILARSEVIRQLEDGFGHIETDGQMQAIDAVYADLEGDKVMDRLVCGDVGFGKTEVAIRSAAVVVSGKLLGLDYAQVALLCPTTFLARQHFSTFHGRFSKLGFKVALISKTLKPKQRAELENAISQGEVDIVIATHSLLSNSISFKNLGLIICDEEQSFGVDQKEKLKRIAPNAHNLTLSATPIPRTLYSALCGVNEISIIETPPIGRVPIKTSIIAMRSSLIKEIIEKERNRGGQVIIITPKIGDIEQIEDMIYHILPEEKFVVVHGKQDAKALEIKMEEFYSGEASILIATTIIATGMDFGNSNTILINRAEMFGLAQLYQIRGRVGRRSKQAFCYFILDERFIGIEAKEKRLRVLENANHFGSGIAVAHMDLDMRGGGNLLGQEQSGKVEQIGIDLYYEMLHEAIESTENSRVFNEDFQPEVSLGKSVFIPNEYIESPRLRLELYRKIANVLTKDDVIALKAEMVDRFGTIPPEIENLFETVEFKQICKKYGIGKMIVGEKAALATFVSSAKLDIDKLTKAMTINKYLKMKNHNTIQIDLQNTANNEQKIALIQKILNQLII